MLKEFSVKNVRTKDKIKLAFIYMLAGFLIFSDTKKAVDLLGFNMATI